MYCMSAIPTISSTLDDGKECNAFVGMSDHRKPSCVYFMEVRESIFRTDLYLGIAKYQFFPNNVI